MFNMRLVLVYLSFYCFFAPIFAQKQDAQWFFGIDKANTPVMPEYAVINLNFTGHNGPKLVRLPKTDMTFDGTSASISDSMGQLQCYSNGIKIFGPAHKLMENGDSMTLSYRSRGEAHLQGALILPYPTRPQQYYAINMQWKFYGAFHGASQLYTHRIDMAQNGGKGRVYEKRRVVLEDTLELGHLTAAKHANGRDWWVTAKEANTNRFFIFLLDKQGFSLKHTLAVGTAIEEGVGRSIFTPDGTKFIRSKNTIINEPAQVDIYDFDRCSGLLSNQRTIVPYYEGNKFGSSVACSSDSRYLYVSQALYIHQYDLTAPDIKATETVVGIYDGFLSAFGQPDLFMQSQLAPDGRIYIGTINVGYHLSYIAHPERPGKDCGFVPHGFNLTALNYGAVPNFPNFRLGPLDGSPCDTLGLDNHPLANFRWEHEDSTQILRVAFTDLSTYEPESWQWDFGDGTTSTARYPVHDYPKEGVYDACLIVKNRFSSDTFCQKVYLGVSVQDNPDLQSRIEVWPNPFSDRLVLVLSTPDLGRPLFRLFDATGRLVREERAEYGLNEMDVSDLGKGMYFWVLEQKGARVKDGKVVKM